MHRKVVAFPFSCMYAYINIYIFLREEKQRTPSISAGSQLEALSALPPPCGCLTT